MAEKKFISKDNLLYVWQKVKGLLGDKVDKVDGKGLSTNDLTDELKQKILNAGDSSFDGQYTSLVGKPSINGVELKSGANTLKELGIQAEVEGKGLSTEDYTTIEKNKLAGVEANAQVNKIESVKINGTAQTINNKAVDITVATKVSELANDRQYQTESQVNSAISTAIQDVTQFDYTIVETLPTTGVKGTIYLVANEGTGNNIYDEYIYINNKFEKMGTTEMDLSGYIKETDLVALTNEEIDEIFTL